MTPNVCKAAGTQRPGAAARPGAGPGPGGTFRTPLHYDCAVIERPVGADWVALTDEPLPVQEAGAWAVTPASGGVVSFSGVVRDHSEGREGVTALTYEAYESEALRRLQEVALETRRRCPDVVRLALLHRVGHLELSETSVVVVASAPHRAEAFEAARFAIDTLKETVPIWKREHWAEGSDWATCAHEVRSVREPAATSRRTDG